MLQQRLCRDESITAAHPAAVVPHTMRTVTRNSRDETQRRQSLSILRATISPEHIKYYMVPVNYFNELQLQHSAVGSTSIGVFERKKYFLLFSSMKTFLTTKQNIFLGLLLYIEFWRSSLYALSIIISV